MLVLFILIRVRGRLRKIVEIIVFEIVVRIV